MFKPTEHKIPFGHVTDTKCTPDYTAAFDKHWGKDGITFWPCIRFAGEKASNGTPKEEQGKQAISYLHYLLLARPDLHITQGLLTTKASITFRAPSGSDADRMQINPLNPQVLGGSSASVDCNPT